MWQKLPEAKEKRILQALPAALGDHWSARALQLMQATHGRMVAQIPHVFRDAGQHAQLREMLERSIREHSATSEMLIWLCAERKDWRELINPEFWPRFCPPLNVSNIPRRVAPANCSAC